MKKNPIEFTDIQIDALKEIGNIGAGHAATALSKMIGRKVMIRLPNVNIVKLETAPKVASYNEEEIVDGVYQSLTGGIEANSLIFFPNKDARYLTEIILEKEFNTNESITEDIKKSVLMESSNIIAGSYINALSTITNMVILPSIPYFISGTAGTIFNSVLAVASQNSQIALMIEIEFIEASNKIHGWFYVMPDIKSSNKILDSLKCTFYE